MDEILLKFIYKPKVGTTIIWYKRDDNSFILPAEVLPFGLFVDQPESGIQQ